MRALVEVLHTVDPGHTFVGVEARDSRVDLMTRLRDEGGLTVRTVRGDKMRTLQGVYDEFAAALQFPGYFGQNKDAFDECIRDLPYLPPGEGLVVIVVEPHRVLVEAVPRDVEWLVGSLELAAVEWGSPIELGEWWDRPAVPFHVVLDVGGASGSMALERWSRAGAEVQLLPID